jgi:methionine-rich copper-binding protein CopC
MHLSLPIAALLFALSLWPGETMAHTRLLTTQPADGAQLQQAPATVALEFSAPVEPGFSRIELHSGSSWKNLPLSQQGKRIEARLPPLQPGTHQLRWSVISRDGHRQNGKLSFTVR